MERPVHYNTLTRFFHHLTAFGILFLMFSVGIHVGMEDSALDEAIWPLHKPIGFLTGISILFRWIWRLIAHHQRPLAANMGAKFFHGIMYLLMAAIPTIALLRQYGSGREFSPLGIPLMSAKDQKIEWMIDLGNQFHGLLGWTLFALVIGHVLMAIIHLVRRDKSPMLRMFGARK